MKTKHVCTVGVVVLLALAALGTLKAVELKAEVERLDPGTAALSKQAQLVDGQAASVLDRASRLQARVGELQTLSAKERDAQIGAIVEEARLLSKELQALEQEVLRYDLPRAESLTIKSRRFDPLQGVLDRTELEVRTLAEDAWARVSGLVDDQPPGCTGDVEWETCDGAGCFACCGHKPAEYRSWCQALCLTKVNQCTRSKAVQNIL